MNQSFFRLGILLILVVAGPSTATGELEVFFAGVDSTGWAQAQSNADGYVLVESPEYPRGLWLRLVDSFGLALAGLQVEYQGRPDSLVALHCVDPAGKVRETLVWSRPSGDLLPLTLKGGETAEELLAGLVPLDWQIDPNVTLPSEPLVETQLTGWEEVESFLRAHWQGQTGRVAFQFNESTSLTISLGRPHAIDRLFAYLQQLHSWEDSRERRFGLEIHDFNKVPDLEESVVLFTSLILDANLERAVRKALGNPASLPTKMDLHSLTRIRAWNDSIRTLQGIEHLINLRDLSLRGNQINDLAPLAGLKNLTTLSLSSNRIYDLSPLADMNNLTSLGLEDNHIQDLTGLDNLDSLTSLGLRNNLINDLAPLAELDNLEKLDLWYNRIKDLTPLTNLNRLKELNLGSEWRGRIYDLSPLANLNNLTSLTLTNNKIEDLTPLANMNNLISLRLEDNYIEDLTPLAKLDSLEVLDLRLNPIFDLTPLAKLDRLKKLHVGNSREYRGLPGPLDLTPLANMDNLISLTAWGNYIEDLTPLANMNNLILLSLSSNYIEDLTPLAELENLEELNLRQNRIVDLTPLKNLNNLEGVDLRNNQIVDITPLTELDSLQWVNLENNPLGPQALNVHIPDLRARGVSVLH